MLLPALQAMTLITTHQFRHTAIAAAAAAPTPTPAASARRIRRSVVIQFVTG